MAAKQKPVGDATTPVIKLRGVFAKTAARLEGESRLNPTGRISPWKKRGI